MSVKFHLSESMKMADGTLSELMKGLNKANLVEGLVVMDLIDKAVALKAGIIGLKNAIEAENHGPKQTIKGG